MPYLIILLSTILIILGNLIGVFFPYRGFLFLSILVIGVTLLYPEAGLKVETVAIVVGVAGIHALFELVSTYILGNILGCSKTSIGGSKSFSTASIKEFWHTFLGVSMVGVLLVMGGGIYLGGVTWWGTLGYRYEGILPKGGQAFLAVLFLIFMRITVFLLLGFYLIWEISQKLL